MAMKCDFCLKGVMYGHNVSHSKRRTNRVFKPNLHPARVLVGTTMRRVKLCTKCLRTYRKMQQVAKELQTATDTVTQVTS